MLKVMVVDDETLARERLKRMLIDDKSYQVVAEAANGEQALQQAKQQVPDIVLLDIRMPGVDGLQAAEQLIKVESPPAIIFCTAYDEYAVHAFDVQAVGYLLKPVRKEALLEALGRAQRLTRVQLQAISSDQEREELPDERQHLPVTTAAGMELLPLVDITHFRADHKYVVAFCNGRERVVDDSLKALELEFGARFLRIHRNCLVSVTHIDSIRRTPSGYSELILRGVDEPLVISRRHLAQVKAVMQRL